MSEDYVQRILRARVYDVARETPLLPAPRLSARLGCNVLLKREDLQSIFSFKLRGAYNRIVRLSSAEAQRGVVAASAGNHAQGVALAASRLGIRAHIVMPITTPSIKVDAVVELGAEVISHGDAYDEAETRAWQEVERLGATFVHPFDDPDVIAGQGTVAVEILRQASDLDAIFVPVGGGGLAAGVLAYTKFLRPDVAVIGVEPADAASLDAALRAGRPVPLDHVGIFADGASTRQVGDEPFRVLRDRIDGVIRVSTDEICAAILDGFEDTRTIAEPAGALALAGMKRWVQEKGAAGKTLVAIQSGANMNFHRLRHISERAEIGERREAILAVTIPERPGSFRDFCDAIGDHNLTEFNYRYSDPERAQVFVGVELPSELRGGQGDDERAKLCAELEKRGYAALDLSDNEMAVVHGRHLVGGRVADLRDERVFRFEFPERPGALRRFLSAMSGRWNITLFHYRNHGAARGRVLVGLQVPDSDGGALERFLADIAYPWVDETSNPAYALFLAAG